MHRAIWPDALSFLCCGYIQRLSKVYYTAQHSLDICESTSFNIGPKCSLIAHPLRSFHDKVVLDLHISH